MKEIKKMIDESIKCKESLAKQIDTVEQAVKAFVKCFKEGNKILIFGNGGSAADAQHIAGELVGKFKLERNPLPVIALTTDTSILTSLSNDLEYEIVFERQVEALASKNDILMGISTSGKSKNVIRAFEKGKEIGTINISLTGNDGGNLKPLSDININIKSSNTPRIQESHLLVYHIICELTEKEMFFSYQKERAMGSKSANKR